MQFVLFVLMSLAPEAASSETPKPEAQPQPTATAPAAKEEKKTCRTVADTGTRLGARKVCTTASERRKSDY